MSIAIPDNAKFSISRRGLEFRGALSFEEWVSLGPRLGEAAQAIAFVIGDWLLYGQRHFAGGGEGSDLPGGRRVRSADYEAAVRMTGLDRSTLQTYAHVARKVPPPMRKQTLSWEHHKVVAKLPHEEQRRWLLAAEGNCKNGRPLSTRRLRRSIQAGRLVEVEEMALAASDRATENHIPMVNRLAAWWARMEERRWIESASAEQRAALKRDLAAVVSIYEQL